jgi:ribonuclease HII
MTENQRQAFEQLLIEIKESKSLTKGERDECYKNINYDKIREEDCARNTLEVFQKNKILKAEDSGGYDEFKIIEVTNEGNLIIKWINSVSCM